ncbi:discoidin domain-containing protein [Paenibacillus antarcticus]|uniref:discoidin domain-containing protein n=1 Tax=Paenibacillus antarcticus TaxID=253703 RepID=UPI0008388E63|nr:discoidin domain-containing protein [Paenibacillus antarcticus]
MKNRIYARSMALLLGFTLLPTSAIGYASSVSTQDIQNVSLTSASVDELLSQKNVTGTIISQSQMTATATSSYTGEGPDKMLDGNVNTKWHTDWSSKYMPLPHSVTLKLGNTYSDVFKLRYLPRQDKDFNGVITKFEISVSMDGTNFTKVAEGQWKGDKSEKSASFPSAGAAYVKLTALESVSDANKQFGSAAEINIERKQGFTLDKTMLPTVLTGAQAYVDAYVGNATVLDGLKSMIAEGNVLMGSAYATQENIYRIIESIRTEQSEIDTIGKLSTFRPGQVWRDTEGNPIQAHGGGIFYQESTKTYYWYGENKGAPNTPGTNRVDVIGVSCYSSKDLYNWKYEGLALSADSSVAGNDLHPSRVLERPKVVYNDTTKKYVMWMHIDSADYSYARAGVAVSDTPVGPFTYIRSERPNNAMSRDMTVYKDEDGKAYLIYSSENNATTYISLLSDDYLSQSGTFTKVFPQQFREAPAMFKLNNKYYLVSSGQSGWAPNAASYAIADSPLGPFTTIENPAVGENANTTFFSQSTHVLPIAGKQGKFIFMGDRWNENNLQDSRYVWLPMEFNKDRFTFKWSDEWNLNVFQGTVSNISGVSVSTVEQVAPILPTSVTVTYSDGTSGEAEVTWEAIDPLRYASAGTFTVNGTVAGTDIPAKVTVTVTVKDGQTRLTSTVSKVTPGQEFDLTYALSGISQDVFAQDLTFAYDANQLDFVSADSLLQGFEVVGASTTEGQVHLVAVNIGANHQANGDWLKLKFRAKPILSARATVTLSNATIADGQGAETSLSGISSSVQIDVIDKAALGTLIAEAQRKHDVAIEGSLPGQYLSGSKATLQASINSANTVFNNTASTQEQVEKAVHDLNAALQTFANAMVPRSLYDLTNDGKISIGDLAVVAAAYGKTSTDADWDLHKIADVNDDKKIDIEDLAAVAQEILK